MTAERRNKTLVERIRALMFESEFPIPMWGYIYVGIYLCGDIPIWGYASHAACWLYNLTPHSSLDFITPYKVFHLR